MDSESKCSLDVWFKRLNFCIYSIENRLKRSPASLSVFIDDGTSIVEPIVRHPPTHDHAENQVSKFRFRAVFHPSGWFR